MKNPLMFGIYQVSKIKFSCPVSLISVNPVKPAGSCLIREDTFICIAFHWLTFREGEGGVEELHEKVVFEPDFEGV